MLRVERVASPVRGLAPPHTGEGVGIWDWMLSAMGLWPERHDTAAASSTMIAPVLRTADQELQSPASWRSPVPADGSPRLYAPCCPLPPPLPPGCYSYRVIGEWIGAGQLLLRIPREIV